MGAIKTPLSRQLINELRNLYPHRCIKKGETPEEAHRYAGAVEVVDLLESCFEKQAEKGVIF